MGILRVSDLESPPYISTQPWVHVHAVTPADRFVLLSSDGLNDFFTNQEAVHEVCRFTAAQPDADPAKHLLEQLLARAADKAGEGVTHRGGGIEVGGASAETCSSISNSDGRYFGRFDRKSDRCFGMVIAPR